MPRILSAIIFLLQASACDQASAIES